MQYQGQLLKYWNKLFVHVQAKIIKSVSHSMWYVLGQIFTK